MASLVPQKPSTPPPSCKAPRRRMVIAASPALPQQCRTRSKSSPAVLVEFPERATSPCSSILSHMSDLQERRVQIEAPEIILFLSADENSDTVLSVVLEEPEASQPSSSRTLPQTDETAAVAAVPQDPHDLCEGGLAELAAERRAAMIRKLLPCTVVPSSVPV